MNAPPKHKLWRARPWMWAVLAALAVGCQAATKTVVAPPGRHSVRSGDLLVLSDFRLSPEHPLIRDLEALREHVSRSLELPPPREQVVVYLFETEAAYAHYLDTVYPGLPRRRAYFVGTPRELAVYTCWGERIQEDLRHEYTHGILHASLGRMPLWLDEGLAEYFEIGGPAPGRINGEYVVELPEALAGGWRPDLARLERLERFEQMQRIDYQEAWAWVHFMLHSTPENRQTLVSYLHDLRDQPQPAPLSKRLAEAQPSLDERFTAYLGSLTTLRSAEAASVP